MLLSSATGGSHDLISFAPRYVEAPSLHEGQETTNTARCRGTGLTLPFSCYPNDISRQVGAQPLAGNASDVALGQIWAKSTLFASNCFAAQNKTGQLIGTAFVVRDMMRIVDALREDGMLRYWGELPKPPLGPYACSCIWMLMNFYMKVSRMARFSARLPSQCFPTKWTGWCSTASSTRSSTTPIRELSWPKRTSSKLIRTDGLRVASLSSSPISMRHSEASLKAVSPLERPVR